MHLSYHNVFPNVSYVFPQTISQDPSRYAQERMWRVDYRCTSLPSYQPVISHPGDYTSSPPCVHHVTRYWGQYSSNVSRSMPSIIGNVQIFPEVSTEIIDWISPALVLTRTRPGWPFSFLWRNLRVNPTQISPYPVKPNLSPTLTWLPSQPRRLARLVTRF
jgi:hypothetical protein